MRLVIDKNSNFTHKGGASGKTPETSTESSPTGQAEQQRDQAHKLAMLSLQSDRYVADVDFADATDAVLRWSKPSPVPEQQKSEAVTGVSADAELIEGLEEISRLLSALRIEVVP